MIKYIISISILLLTVTACSHAAGTETTPFPPLTSPPPVVRGIAPTETLVSPNTSAYRKALAHEYDTARADVLSALVRVHKGDHSSTNASRLRQALLRLDEAEFEFISILSEGHGVEQSGVEWEFRKMQASKSYEEVSIFINRCETYLNGDESSETLVYRRIEFGYNTAFTQFEPESYDALQMLRTVDRDTIWLIALIMVNCTQGDLPNA